MSLQLKKLLMRSIKHTIGLLIVLLVLGMIIIGQINDNVSGHYLSQVVADVNYLSKALVSYTVKDKEKLHKETDEYLFPLSKSFLQVSAYNQAKELQFERVNSLNKHLSTLSGSMISKSEFVDKHLSYQKFNKFHLFTVKIFTEDTIWEIVVTDEKFRQVLARVSAQTSFIFIMGLILLLAWMSIHFVISKRVLDRRLAYETSKVAAHYPVSDQKFLNQNSRQSNKFSNEKKPKAKDSNGVPLLEKAII